MGDPKSPYAKRVVRNLKGKRSTIYLHRAIMNAPKGLVVNHRDGDTMNNTRANLHCVRQRTNTTKLRVSKGKLKFHGIHFKCGGGVLQKGKKTVQAKIRINGVRKYLGVFETPEEAARAYDLAAVDAFGELADTNFPLSDYLCPVSFDLPAEPEQEEIPF